MKDKFINLEAEKREKIINAAMAEFALHGYDKASTNCIVKNAGISKGLLFHYFKTKKELFLFLYDYGIERLSDDFYGKIDLTDKDLFKILHQILFIKINLYKKYPDLFQFINICYLDTSNEIKKDIQLRNMSIIQEGNKLFFDNLDKSYLKENVDVSEVLSVITWSMEGLLNDEYKKCRILNQNLDYDVLFIKAEKLIKTLKKLFSREVI